MRISANVTAHSGDRDRCAHRSGAGVDFNLADIPVSFNAPHREEFDAEYMQALFRSGFDMAAKGYPWEKAPPVF